MKMTLGDRMKMYESAEAGRKLMLNLPVAARIDGRTFHSFTRGMKRPYDVRLSECMISTTIELVKHTGACMGYTQSDEITLLWPGSTEQSQIWFDGRIMKMTSQLAAQATLFFYREVLKVMPEYADRMPTFDARVWNLPNQEESCNLLIWREWDATKNSVQMAASSVYSQKALHGKHQAQQMDMLMDKGINWNDYQDFFKKGTYVQRTKEKIKFSYDELLRLPIKHEAHTNPDLVVERSCVKEVVMPIFTKIVNRQEVVFCGAPPLTLQDCVVIDRADWPAQLD